MSARTLVHHEETPDSNDNDVQQSTELEDDEYMKINNTDPEPMEEPTTLNNVLSISVDETATTFTANHICLLYTSPSPRDKRQSRMPSSA